MGGTFWNVLALACSRNAKLASESRSGQLALAVQLGMHTPGGAPAHIALAWPGLSNSGSTATPRALAYATSALSSRSAYLLKEGEEIGERGRNLGPPPRHRGPPRAFRAHRSRVENALLHSAGNAADCAGKLSSSERCRWST